MNAIDKEQLFETVKEQVQELMEKLLVPGVAFGIIPGDYVSTARPGITKADDPTRNL